MNYIQLSDVQQYKDIVLTANGQALFNLLLPGMQGMIDQFCNRSWNFMNPVTQYFNAFEDGIPPRIKDTFYPQAYVDTAPFNNAFPRAGGINSITVGEVNGAGGTPLDLTYVYNYKTYIKVWTWNYMFNMFNPLGFLGVKIVYNSSDASPDGTSNVNVPAPVRLALIVWLSRILDNSSDSGKEAIEVQTDTVRAKFAQDKIGSLPDFVKLALDPYRIPVFDHF